MRTARYGRTTWRAAYDNGSLAMNATASARTSSSALRGRGIGTLVCAAFAAFWASSSRPEWPAGFDTAAFAMIALITGALIVAGIGMIRRSRQLPSTIDALSGKRRRTGVHFAAIVVAEIIVMNITAYLLTEHHLETYLVPAIAIIVGLHFFPLAQVFRARRYHLTAALMTLAGVGGVVAIVSGLAIAPATAIVDVACAMILWVTGFASYVSTMRSIR
jgi:hypothetical protein